LLAATGDGVSCRLSPRCCRCSRIPCLEASHPRNTVRVWPISVHERALSATGLAYEGRRLADMELLTPPKTHDESMEHLHRPHSASPYRLLRWPLTPDAHHIVRALALASPTALRFP
jgi:hypothetical protein